MFVVRRYRAWTGCWFEAPESRRCKTMSDSSLLRVQLAERGYDIEIGSGNLIGLRAFVRERVKLTRAVLITDENLQGTHAAAAVDSLMQLAPGDLLVVPPGEDTKCLAAAEQLWQALLDCGADRHAAVIAVGGGVVGDLAGFVAATFARGLPFIQVPTTLLAQVDSSVGGKVGVNLPGAKNIVGAFWQPAGVLIDTAVLATLPEREYRAGLAEVVKYGVILDAEFFAYLETNVAAVNRRDNAALRRIVYRCCELKADVVRQDERELTGQRAVLNYGHTFAHAIETLSGYGELLHGEAVAIGMMQAARLAERLGRIDSDFVHRQRDLFTAFGLPIDAPRLPPDEMLAVMSRDKKSLAGRLRFVLPTRLGHVELVDGVNEAIVREILA